MFWYMESLWRLICFPMNQITVVYHSMCEYFVEWDIENPAMEAKYVLLLILTLELFRQTLIIISYQHYKTVAMLWLASDFRMANKIWSNDSTVTWSCRGFVFFRLSYYLQIYRNHSPLCISSPLYATDSTLCACCPNLVFPKEGPLSFKNASDWESMIVRKLEQLLAQQHLRHVAHYKVVFAGAEHRAM